MKTGLRWSDDQLAAHQSKFAALQEPKRLRDERAEPGVAANTEKPRKYRNIPTVVNGITFASRKEAKTYAGLLLLEQKGDIRGLELQQPYSIDINGVHICDYIADFAFWRGDKRVLVDTKGIRTPAFKLKARLMAAVYGVQIEEV